MGIALLTLYLILSLIFFSLTYMNIADPNRPSAIKTLLTNTHLILKNEFAQPVKTSFKDALRWMGDALISFLRCFEGYWRMCPSLWRKMHILVGIICIYLWIVGTLEIIDIFFVGYFLIVTSFFIYFARLPIWWYNRIEWFKISLLLLISSIMHIFKQNSIEENIVKTSQPFFHQILHFRYNFDLFF